jgi:hypothetical protein
MNAIIIPDRIPFGNIQDMGKIMNELLKKRISGDVDNFIANIFDLILFSLLICVFKKQFRVKFLGRADV